MQLGSGHPSMPTTCENLSGGSVQLIFGSHFTKINSFCPPYAQIKWKIHFCGEKQKNLVGKVAGHEKMHISAKNGVMTSKFAMDLARTLLDQMVGIKDKQSYTWYQSL